MLQGNFTTQTTWFAGELLHTFASVSLQYTLIWIKTGVKLVLPVELIKRDLLGPLYRKVYQS